MKPKWGIYKTKENNFVALNFLHIKSIAFESG